jgi:chromosome segregation ATPase
MLTKVAADLENEKATLVTVEKKLASAQKEVEAKEFQQQEVKAAKEEDENKLAELLSNFKDLSSESIELEQKLAQSMKNLDKILSEINVTEDQRAVLNNLNDSLTSAGSLLRELITESEMVNERLKVLKEQHSDLEEEYTRLVEQQLGE